MSPSVMAFQTYPVPTELPPLHEGETDARYMDCTPALAPVGDYFVDMASVAISISRMDGSQLSVTDLTPAPSAWPSSLDNTGRIVTMGWRAPAGSGGRTYLLIMTAPTRDGRIFVRTWIMSVIPTP
jgi:hypothetical protein